MYCPILAAPSGWKATTLSYIQGGHCFGSDRNLEADSPILKAAIGGDEASRSASLIQPKG